MHGYIVLRITPVSQNIILMLAVLDQLGHFCFAELNWLFFFFTFIYLFEIWKVRKMARKGVREGGRKRERERAGESRFLSAGQDWARLKSGTWRSIQVSHAGSRALTISAISSMSQCTPWPQTEMQSRTGTWTQTLWNRMWVECLSLNRYGWWSEETRVEVSCRHAQRAILHHPSYRHDSGLSIRRKLEGKYCK